MQFMILIILLIILIVIVLYIKSLKPSFYVYQFDNNFGVNKSAILDPQWTDILHDYKMQLVNVPSDANIIYFTDYAYIDIMLPKLKEHFYSDTYIYAFAGQDQIAHKALLAIYIRAKYPEIIAKTYVLMNGEIPEEQAIYFLKKNIQRQEGNFISSDLNYIQTKAASDSYVIAQELMQDVYLVNKRKINMRFYMLVTIRNQQCEFYIYNNGFMYYTPDFYKPNSIEKNHNITTGYIDRQVYVDNPLTHHDFYATLSESDVLKFKNNIRILFEKVKDVYAPVFLDRNRDIPGYKFNILGVDIAPTHDLNAHLIEVNKYPSLQYMDARDRELKYNMLVNMFALVGILDKSSDNTGYFVKI